MGPDDDTDDEAPPRGPLLGDVVFLSGEPARAFTDELSARPSPEGLSRFPSLPRFDARKLALFGGLMGSPFVPDTAPRGPFNAADCTLVPLVDESGARRIIAGPASSLTPGAPALKLVPEAIPSTAPWRVVGLLTRGISGDVRIDALHVKGAAAVLIHSVPVPAEDYQWGDPMTPLRTYYATVRDGTQIGSLAYVDVIAAPGSSFSAFLAVVPVVSQLL